MYVRVYVCNVYCVCILMYVCNMYIYIHNSATRWKSSTMDNIFFLSLSFFFSYIRLYEISTKVNLSVVLFRVTFSILSFRGNVQVIKYIYD